MRFLQDPSQRRTRGQNSENSGTEHQSPDIRTTLLANAIAPSSSALSPCSPWDSRFEQEQTEGTEALRD